MSNNVMTQTEVRANYGKRNDWSNFVKFIPPFQMYLSWEPEKKVKFFYCHGLIEPMLQMAFTNLLHCYSDEAIHELGIDLYAGCHANRKMRKGNMWSRHAWAIAIDLHSAKNRLEWRKDKAIFATSDYDDMMQCFYDAGFINYGVEKGYDYMHFEPSNKVNVGVYEK